jgi:uncharacterized protein YxjI
MAKSYLMSRKWALTDRFAITDDAGTPQFDVQGKFSFTKKLSICDAVGTEVAVLTKGGFSNRFEILAGGQHVTVRPRGFLGQRFEIDSPAGLMEARGNFSGRRFSVTRGGAQVASVSQPSMFRQQFSVDVADGEDPVLLLSVVLAIETIRAERASAAAGAAAGAG